MRRIGAVLAREKPHQQDLARRQTPAQIIDDRGDSLDDLRRFTGLNVVGADNKHDDLRFQIRELTVLEPPEHALGAITADSELTGIEGRELFVPYGLPFARVPPPLSDGIANEDDVEV